MINHRRKVIGKLFRLFLFIAVFVIIALTSIFFSIYYSAKLNNENINKMSGKLIIYDISGNEIDLPASCNNYAHYKDISKHIINAFVALEDKRFYKHDGIDYIRLGGALLNNLKAGYIKEGGFTITQQLAKNTQLNNEKTLQRKIKEAKLAKDIEKRYSKEEILEMYLNAIYFGNGIYGVAQACKTFFDKKPSEIEIYEAAILAGVVKNPSKNSPLQHPENANVRKNLVLKLMKEQGYISSIEYAHSVNMVFNPLKEISYGDAFFPYYKSAISEASRLLNISEKSIIQMGLRIYTYYDPLIQQTVYDAFLSKQFETENPPDYSVIMLDNKSGGVLAYYATHNYSVFNLRRQPGSAIKPILVYAPALNSEKITAATVFRDKKTSFNGYQPSNYKNKYLGYADIRTAVKTSSNVIAVKVLNETGIEYSKQIASKMGLRFADGDNNLALALGGMTEGVTSLELAESYMCLANGGFHTPSTFIKSIYDRNGNLMYMNHPMFERVISSSAAFIMTDMLKDAVKSGTAKKLNGLDFDIASKTGTVGSNNSNTNKDAWSLSYTKDNTLCVWYGNIEYRENKDFTITGGAQPTMLAKYIYKNMPSKPADFDVPDSIIELRIDSLALNKFHKAMLATPNTPIEYQKSEIFDISNSPMEFSPLFTIPKTNLSVRMLEDYTAQITFDTIPYFKYKVIKTNLFTGKREIIYTVDGNEGTMDIYDNCQDDIGIIGYSLEIDNDYCCMGESEEKFLIINPTNYGETISTNYAARESYRYDYVR